MIAQAVRLATCLHCGTLITGETDSNLSENFCCSGCKFVFEFMQDQGLAKFYDLRSANPPDSKTPIESSNSNFESFDDPEFLLSKSDNGSRVRFYLKGMDCAACVWVLEKLPEYCPDVKSARVNLAESTIEIERQRQGKFSSIARVLNSLGYRPQPLREDESSVRLQKREQREDMIRIGVAGALTGNIMILTVSLYGGASGLLARQFHWLTALLALPVLTYCAFPFYKSAYYSLRSFRLNIDVPIVAALLAGLVTSSIALIQSTDAIYFDSLSMLVFLLLSSRYFLRSLQKRHSQSTNIEDDLLTGVVQLVTPAGFQNINASKLEPGDLIHVKSGTLFPIDGVVDQGQATVSAAVLTGESTPVQIGVGSIIEAGYRCIGGDFVVRVVNRTRQTRLAKILRETERLADTKSEFVHLADRAAQYFIGVVFFFAASIALYFAGSNPGEGISRALALIIVTCPCVFGIAIPLSMALTLRRAAKNGIIVKSSDAIERLWNVKTVFFDKTATLTEGSMMVIRHTQTDAENLQIVYGLEKNQDHPVARTLVGFARAAQVNVAKYESIVDDVAPLKTGGVVGYVHGHQYKIEPARHRTKLANEPSLLVSTFELRKDDKVVSTFELGDRPRAEAASVLQVLRARGLKTVMLSGDRKHAAEACAATLDFSPNDVFTEMTPESKAMKIKESDEVCLMIGDGANDAAAFAAASVGIAVCGSLDVSLRSADVYLTRPDLNCIPKLLKIAAEAKSAIYRNLAFSVSFNVTAGTMAALGLMTPLWAAVLMPLSSLIVLVSANWETTA